MLTGKKHKFPVGRFEKKNCSEDLGVNGMIILKWAIRM
jgi:hypothetical protein